MNYLQATTESGIVLVEFKITSVVDPSTAASVWSELKQIVADSNGARVIVDFSVVELASSALVGAMLTFRSLGRARGFSLKLCGLVGELKSLFSATELDGLFKVYRSRKSAVESYQAENSLQRLNRLPATVGAA